MVGIINSLASKKDGSCVAFIGELHDDLHVFAVDATTNQFLPMIYSAKATSSKQFIKDIPKLFGLKLSSAILQIHELKASDFESTIELCKAIKAKFDSLKIPTFFTTGLEFHFSSMIIEAKIEPKIGEKVVIGLPKDDYALFEFEFTKNGWKQLNSDHFDIQDLRDRLTHQCKNVILPNIPPPIIPLFIAMTAGTSAKLIPFAMNFESFMKKYMLEISKRILKKTGNEKYFIIPTVRNVIEIRHELHNPALLCFTNETCPATKTRIIPKSMTHIVESNTDISVKNSITEGHIMDQKSHRIKLTLSVDESRFFTFKSEGIMLTQIENLPKTLNEKMESKIPVIGFCDDFSVLCIYSEKDGGYKFADEWNGVYGNLCFINFGHEKIKFGTDAILPVGEKGFGLIYDMDMVAMSFTMRPRYVNQGRSSSINSKNDPQKPHREYHIRDLIKIISMKPEDIKADESWGFKIAKDEKNEVLLEFYSHGEILKAASPAFLMALLLKQHLKVIKKETPGGQKPDKLGFCILDEKYSAADKERIKDGLKKACDLLKTGYDFVEIVV